MVNGLELGKEIRRLDREAQIIYATTEPQFALQAYAASPINYLIKPIEKQQLFDTLTLAISKADLTEDQTFAVKTAESMRVIKLSDIICSEYRNHAAIFRLANGEKYPAAPFVRIFQNMWVYFEGQDFLHATPRLLSICAGWSACKIASPYTAAKLCRLRQSNTLREEMPIWTT
jgi:CheY-like chemotaxis protein